MAITDDDDEMMIKAADCGCYLAAVNINRQEMMTPLEDYANQLIKQKDFDYHSHQDQPFVSLESLYDKEYQVYLTAKSLAERLPVYEKITKFAKAGYPQAIYQLYLEGADLMTKELKSLDEIKFAYLTVTGLSNGYGENDREIRLHILDIIVEAAQTNHYNDYLKKAVEHYIDLMEIKDFKNDESLAAFLRIMYFYSESLPKNKSNLYNRDRIIKKSIDKLEKSHSKGMNGIIEKYRPQNTDQAKAVIFMLGSLKAMK